MLSTWTLLLTHAVCSLRSIDGIEKGSELYWRIGEIAKSKNLTLVFRDADPETLLSPDLDPSRIWIPSEVDPSQNRIPLNLIPSFES